MQDSYFDTLGWILLALSFASIWIRRDYRIWETLFAASLIVRIIEGKLLVAGLAIILAWAILWNIYKNGKNRYVHFGLFLLFIGLSFGFKFHLFPGFIPSVVTQNFQISLETSILGIFPLALLGHIAKSRDDWKAVGKGLMFGSYGIFLMALMAIISGALHVEFKLPSHAAARFAHNFFLVSIPEEAFYRGFVQHQISRYLHSTKWGHGVALITSSVIFAIAHLYWAPSLAMLGFVFIASLLYGGVYLVSGKIESAILCHFLLNVVHMCCFSYHAM